ncbi:hypothetical protein SHIRM173S_11367 [Streptomyces hirsutus]
MNLLLTGYTKCSRGHTLRLMTDAQTRHTTGTNPLAPTPAGARTAVDVVTPKLVAQLTKGVVGSGRTANHTPFTGEKLADLPESDPRGRAAGLRGGPRRPGRVAADPGTSAGRCAARFHDLVLERQAEVLDLIQLGDRQGPPARPRQPSSTTRSGGTSPTGRRS